MPDHGTFSGLPRTEWLGGVSGEDRDMRLLEDFSFSDPAGKSWPALKGSVGVDPGSTPFPRTVELRRIAKFR